MHPFLFQQPWPCSTQPWVTWYFHSRLLFICDLCSIKAAPLLYYNPVLISTKIITILSLWDPYRHLTERSYEIEALRLPAGTTPKLKPSPSAWLESWNITSPSEAPAMSWILHQIPVWISSEHTQGLPLQPGISNKENTMDGILAQYKWLGMCQQHPPHLSAMLTSFNTIFLTKKSEVSGAQYSDSQNWVNVWYFWTIHWIDLNVKHI